MAEASPLFTVTIDVISMTGSLLLMAGAAFVDLRTMTIPNTMTFPAIALGLCLDIYRVIDGADPLLLLLMLVLSWAFVYALWAGGMWGGGDAKAVFAVFILLSPMFFPLGFILVFSMSLAGLIFLREIGLWALGHVRKRRERPLAPLLFLSTVLSLAGAAFI